MDIASSEFAFEQSLQKGIMDGDRRGGKQAASSFFHRLERPCDRSRKFSDYPIARVAKIKEEICYE
jgi:hypothetical protein